MTYLLHHRRGDRVFSTDYKFRLPRIPVTNEQYERFLAMPSPRYLSDLKSI